MTMIKRLALPLALLFALSPAASAQGDVDQPPTVDRVTYRIASGASSPFSDVVVRVRNGETGATAAELMRSALANGACERLVVRLARRVGLEIQREGSGRWTLPASATVEGSNGCIVRRV